MGGTEQEIKMEIKQEFFQKLLECKWLENCGSDIDANYDFKTMLVTKEEAKKRIVSIKWQNACLDGENDITEYLFVYHRDKYNQIWNKQVEKLHAEYYPQLEEVIHKNILEQGLSEEVEKNIKINFIRIMMNHFYSEYFESEFLKKLLIIYLSGHIPCGITGNRETGTIMVY